ncbi:MAG: glycosyltransferase, partial [Planctomycetota bacterium]
REPDIPPATETPAEHPEAAPPATGHPTPAVKPLTWALAIATYQRHDVLMDCVGLALAQTRPPAEVVIADASPNWTDGRDQLFARFCDAYPNVTFIYEQARRPSAAVQRNQVAELATADILFLIDDDSLMHPGCAAEVLDLYELDPDHHVAGIALLETPIDPRQSPLAPGQAAPACTSPQAQSSAAKPHSGLVRWVRRLLDADNLFIPYDAEFPDHPTPPAIAQAKHVGTRQLMAGKTMTARRELVLREPFSELLDRAANGEDSDMSYRLSRHGALLTALDAPLFHLGSPGGRMKPFQNAALGALNPLVHHRLHSTDLERSRKANRALLRRRRVIALLKDLKARRWSLPEARGYHFALRHLDTVLDQSPEALPDWYPAFQKQITEGRRD